MVKNIRRLSYVQLERLSHTPEGKAEIERRRFRNLASLAPQSSRIDRDRIVSKTVSRIREIFRSYLT